LLRDELSAPEDLLVRTSQSVEDVALLRMAVDRSEPGQEALAGGGDLAGIRGSVIGDLSQHHRMAVEAVGADVPPGADRDAAAQDVALFSALRKLAREMPAALFALPPAE
jgi:hypothetical protein